MNFPKIVLLQSNLFFWEKKSKNRKLDTEDKLNKDFIVRESDIYHKNKWYFEILRILSLTGFKNDSSALKTKLFSRLFILDKNAFKKLFFELIFLF